MRLQAPCPRGAACTLDELQARIAYDLECLAYPAAEWVPKVQDRLGRPVHAAVVVGGGQGGLATAFALRREGVHDVLQVDRAPAGLEGPWVTFARMHTLRTPKYLTGPDYGVATLTFRAWFEAQWGGEAWDALERIPTAKWMDYLRWFREVTGAQVRNGTEMTAIRGTPDGFVEIDLVGPEGSSSCVTRRLVLANGMDGGGLWYVPPLFTRGLPRTAWAHSSERIDFGRLRGARVAVLGAGAAAFDAAAAALDHGAAVDLYHRRPALLRIEFRPWLEQAGFLAGFGDLDDARKWSVMRRLLGAGAPPPPSAIERVAGRTGFAVHAACGWRAVHHEGGQVRIDTDLGDRSADFVVFATGVRYELGLRPEFAALAPVAACWSDRFTPLPEESNEEVGRFPYLGPGFELTERSPGAAPWLSRIHLFNYAATASLGVTGSSGTGMKLGLRRLTSALVRALYAESADVHIAGMPWPRGASAAPE